MFPAPHGSGIESLNLDVTHNDLIKIPDEGPDIVILPSNLKHFAKVSLSLSRSHMMVLIEFMMIIDRRFYSNSQPFISHSKFFSGHIRSSDHSSTRKRGVGTKS